MTRFIFAMICLFPSFTLAQTNLPAQFSVSEASTSALPQPRPIMPDRDLGGKQPVAFYFDDNASDEKKTIAGLANDAEALTDCIAGRKEMEQLSSKILKILGETDVISPKIECRWTRIKKRYYFQGWHNPNDAGNPDENSFIIFTYRETNKKYWNFIQIFPWGNPEMLRARLYNTGTVFSGFFEKDRLPLTILKDKGPMALFLRNQKLVAVEPDPKKRQMYFKDVGPQFYKIPNQETELILWNEAYGIKKVEIPGKYDFQQVVQIYSESQQINYVEEYSDIIDNATKSSPRSHELIEKLKYLHPATKNLATDHFRFVLPAIKGETSAWFNRGKLGTTKNTFLMLSYRDPKTSERGLFVSYPFQEKRGFMRLKRDEDISVFKWGEDATPAFFTYKNDSLRRIYVIDGEEYRTEAAETEDGGKKWEGNKFSGAGAAIHLENTGDKTYFLRWDWKNSKLEGGRSLGEKIKLLVKPMGVVRLPADLGHIDK